MTENVAFIRTFKTFEEAEAEIKRLKDPENYGVIQLYYDRDLSLYTFATLKALEEIQR